MGSTDVKQHPQGYADYPVSGPKVLSQNSHSKLVFPYNL